MAANKNVLLDADSERDKELLKPEETTLDLPDVEDIPGQENIHPPVLDEMADTTISSDDEEGAGLFNDNTSINDVGNLRNISEDDNGVMPTSQLVDEDDTLDEDDLSGDEDEIDIDDDAADDADADVSDEEAELLQESADSMPTKENREQQAAQLDNTDLDGDELNETINKSGDDIDTPGTELDDDDEAIGEEDEENNNYSMGDNE